jgi:hypothetical protein
MTDRPEQSGDGNLVAANRAARLGTREAVRQARIAERRALRSDREAAAASALTRGPRWTRVRGTTPAAEAVPDPSPDVPEAAEPELTAIDVPEAVPEVIPEGAAKLAPESPIEEPTEAPTEAPVEAPMTEPGSVFAAMMGGLAAKSTPAVAAVRPAAARLAPPTPAVALAPEPEPKIAPAPGASAITALGPGMLARLRLLGYERITDLAGADPSELRHALGDISRLLNVEGWIAEARRQAQSRDSNAA